MSTGATTSTKPIIVVGTGPVGIRFISTYLDTQGRSPLMVFGDEPWEPYNRVALSSLLAGQSTFESIANPIQTHEQHRLLQHHNLKITAISPKEKTVTDEMGHVHSYHTLVLATGSSPYIPPIPGVDLKGVFTFRNLDDAQKLIARRVRARHVVVVGGGLLGLETARAMQRENTAISIIQLTDRLMDRQLDVRAGAILAKHIASKGIMLRVNAMVKKIKGVEDVEAIVLRDGKQIPCDTVILSTGITPNIALAQASGLAYGRGIKVNDHLQTSADDVYAIGECAEHNGEVYGLVAPGFEQASVLANRLAGGEAHYLGSTVASSLKVVGADIFSVGDIDEDHKKNLGTNAVYEDESESIYRNLYIRRWRITGAVGVGDWPEKRKLQEAVINKRIILPWNLWRFKQTGCLWAEEEVTSVRHWPADTVVCNCMNITRGQLSVAMDSGCNTYEKISEKTKASTVCGTCKPLVCNLLGGNVPQTPEKGESPLLVFSILAALLCSITYFSPAIPTPSSITTVQWDFLWRDGLAKQITGFTLLGLSLIAVSMSLRKRWAKVTFGEFPYWRVIHAIVGSLAIAVLLAHTGFNLGENLNQILMVDFLLLAVLGGLAGLIIAIERRIAGPAGKRLRRYWSWAHILLVWPLPALLGIHIFCVYYY